MPRIAFPLIVAGGCAAVWLAVDYGWRWGVVVVLLLAAAITYCWNRQLADIELWLRQRVAMEDAEHDGDISGLISAIAKMRGDWLARLGSSNRLLARIRRAVDELPIAVVLLGYGYRIDWANRYAAKLLAVHWPADANVPLQHLCREPALRRVLESGSEAEELEIVSPARRDVRLQLNVFRHEVATLVFARDVTESHRVRRMRRDFVANASHELRTPLAVVASITESMEQEKRQLPEKWLQPVQSLRRRVLVMVKLVDDMLSLSRLESAGAAAPDEHEAVDVAELCERVGSDLAEHLEDKSARLGLKLDSHGSIQGNREELHLVLSNLVLNAVNHNDPGVEITISWFRTEDGHCLQVADNGIGIEAKHLPHLSERFYRVDKQRGRSGTGLGLSMVRQALLRHDASMKIQSSLGQGSAFSCHFPKSRCR